jgi:hypothetical protein
MSYAVDVVDLFRRSASLSLPLSPPPCTSSEKLPEIYAKSPHSLFERHNFSGLLRRWRFLSFLATHPFPRQVPNGMLTYVNLSSSLEACSDCFHSNPVPLFKSSNTIVLAYFRRLSEADGCPP